VAQGPQVTEVTYVACGDQHLFLGSFGLHGRQGPGELEIGYWVNSRCTRRGIATTMAALLSEAAFTIPGIEAIEIHHDRANHASGGIPMRLGYQLSDPRSANQRLQAKRASRCCGAWNAVIGQQAPVPSC